MKKISIIFIISGLVLIAYPLIDRIYSNYMQVQALEAIDASLFSNDIQETSDDLPVPAEQMKIQEGKKVEEQSKPAGKTVEENNKPTTQKEIKKTVVKPIGIIKIDKIGLTLPILNGASSSNLKAGACFVKGTTKIGSIGNAAIAAHRSHTYGRFFNRLNELNTGDEVSILEGDKTLVYKVYEKLIVEPEDTSVLNRNKTDRVLTLITCDPIIHPTHRLIIHAKQI
jgi:sortase A